MRPKWSVVRKLEGQVSSEFIKLDQLEEEEREGGVAEHCEEGERGCCLETAQGLRHVNLVDPRRDMLDPRMLRAKEESRICLKSQSSCYTESKGCIDTAGRRKASRKQFESQAREELGSGHRGSCD